MAKRGRPRTRASQEKRLKAGRPSKHLHEHPDRYAIAALDAIELLFNGNQRKAADALVGLIGGEKISGRNVGIAVEIDAMLFEKAPDRLRSMAKRYTAPADLRWREAMAQAMLMATTLGPKMETAIIATAASVGEEEWARGTLLPLIRRGNI
ncbi:hypothetical protein [Bradyrhizobium sp. NBAIM02]|uniref:hypothetical protein n=1 Tax=Bradyrhizobium sp. NBAIM02 TaxID=2793817 RepID=UPI001CD3DC6F|nr:hypothetical protein [Bradyrhizobium sp. NBAIM02]MCA1503807.1 hypothetical protein [Bradyrhizobium sp. NBAIM02]